MAHIVDKKYHRTDVFEIVDEFPEGYTIWNIGRENFQYERFIPLAKPDPQHEHHIMLDCLKTIKCESEELALYILDELDNVKGDISKVVDKYWFERKVEEFNDMY